MPSLLHAPLTELESLLDAYADGFEWYCFCLVCGHQQPAGHDTLQELYQSQARWRGGRMRELYPLVCAHWDVVNLAHEIADAKTEVERKPLLALLRQAKARHRRAVQALRATWEAA
ncbi:hypothetical protein EZ313_06695 [Ramlibacter henchirensis]|uniref:Uncharacterized protein n=1 Tax=Ramlibacter henchirensis TaxID=204072 RepID=A0A4Z0C8B5_9BURK|nr:hypothetical protein [Ramlibacter henchirensis]TFZ06329.1 hypothetical protein EZ313_06695 [Ramlibacter henchirensis]